jgi:transposase-like protein
MNKKYKLPSLDTFQRKLADFYQTIKAQKEQEQLDARTLQAYKETLYEYHLKGTSMRALSQTTGISLGTVGKWIKEIETAKAKAKEQPKDYIQEAKELKASTEQPQHA